MRQSGSAGADLYALGGPQRALKNLSDESYIP